MSDPRCSDKDCPYDLEQYSSHPQYHGLCLNCLDDKEKDDRFAREEYDDAMFDEDMACLL